MRSAANVVIGARQSFFDRVGPTWETAPLRSIWAILRLEVGRFAGAQGNLPVTGLAMDVGIVYYQASNEAAAGIGEDALDVRGALAVTASRHYAPHAMAAGISTHYPILAAGVTRPRAGQNTS